MMRYTCMYMYVPVMYVYDVLKIQLICVVVVYRWRSWKLNCVPS